MAKDGYGMMPSDAGTKSLPTDYTGNAPTEGQVTLPDYIGKTVNPMGKHPAA